jgi:hypothetical protein
LQELRDPLGCGSGGTAYSEARADGLECASGVIVEIEVRLLSRDAVPEVDVGFIPHFEVPLGDFLDAVTVNEVLGEVLDEVIPSLHALWWRDILFIPKGVKRVWVEGELLGHETDFDEGADAAFEQAVVDGVDVSEVVDGVSMLVLVVDTDLVVQDCVETNVAEIGYFFYGAKVFTIVFAQCEDGASGAEHLLPEVRERSGGCVGVDGDDFIGDWLRLREAWAGNTEKNQRERKGSASAASHCDLVLNSGEGLEGIFASKRLGPRKDGRHGSLKMVRTMPAFV